MSNSKLTATFADDAWYRLAVASGLALGILLVVVFLAARLADHEQSTYQKVQFDGYQYFAEKSDSAENFLSIGPERDSADLGQKNFPSAMRGEHWVWFSPSAIAEDLEILQLELVITARNP